MLIKEEEFLIILTIIMWGGMGQYRLSGTFGDGYIGHVILCSA